MTEVKYLSSISLDGKRFRVGSLVKYTGYFHNEYWALITKIERKRNEIVFFNLFELSDKENFWVPYEDLINNLVEMHCVSP